MTYAQLRANQHAQEASVIRSALVYSRWRASLAAAELGIAGSTLQRLMSRHPEIRRDYDAALLARKHKGAK